MCIAHGFFHLICSAMSRRVCCVLIHSTTFIRKGTVCEWNGLLLYLFNAMVFHSHFLFSFFLVVCRSALFIRTSFCWVQLVIGHGVCVLNMAESLCARIKCEALKSLCRRCQCEAPGNIVIILCNPNWLKIEVEDTCTCFHIRIATGSWFIPISNARRDSENDSIVINFFIFNSHRMPCTNEWIGGCAPSTSPLPFTVFDSEWNLPFHRLCNDSSGIFNETNFKKNPRSCTQSSQLRSKRFS